MENLLQDLTKQAKGGLTLLRNNPTVQYGVLGVYLLLWLLFSGLLTSAWVALGVGIGWAIGKGPDDENAPPAT